MQVAKCLTTTGNLGNTLGFAAFFSMFQLLFYYSEFMMHAGEVYRQCMSSGVREKGGGRGVVRSLQFLEAVRAYVYAAQPGGAAAGRYPKPAFEVVEAVMQQLAAAAQEEQAQAAEAEGKEGGSKAEAGGESEGGEEKGKDADKGSFHAIPVVGGVPITFNDICAGLVRKTALLHVAAAPDERMTRRGVCGTGAAQRDGGGV